MFRKAFSRFSCSDISVTSCNPRIRRSESSDSPSLLIYMSGAGVCLKWLSQSLSSVTCSFLDLRSTSVVQYLSMPVATLMLPNSATVSALSWARWSWLFKLLYFWIAFWFGWIELCQSSTRRAGGWRIPVSLSRVTNGTCQLVKPLLA